MIPADQSCSNCQFFKVELTENPDTGQCMRYPPQVSYPAGVGFADLSRSMVWPVTRPSEWCGEWVQTK